jgi:aminoglycoside 3-N-acetyltransferase
MATVASSFKRAVKDQKKAIEAAFVRRRYAFSKQDLLEGLRRLGVRSGDALLVHSSLDQFIAFAGTPTDITATLIEAVGDTGHILMPTLPFRGTALDYALSGRVFNVDRTPSQTGLLTELFRRSPGVVRSVHPTHSVAVRGPRAAYFAAEHNLATTPCGRSTPYSRLLDEKGKILFMGTDIGVMTFFHFIEEEIESQLPFSPFTQGVYTLRSLDSTGTEVMTHTRLFDPTYSRKRNLDKLASHLKKRAVWHECRIGNVALILLAAEDVLSICRELAGDGIYCYDV